MGLCLRGLILLGLLTVLTVVTGNAATDSGHPIGETTQTHAFDQNYSVWVDSEGDRTLNDLLQSPPAWQDVSAKPLRHFYRSEPVWSRFTLHNSLKSSRRYILEIENPMLDRVDFYQVDTVRGEPPEVSRHALAGDHFPLQEGELSSRFLTFPVVLRPGVTTEIYLRIESTSALIAPVSLWRTRQLISHEITLNVYYGAFFGIMGVMALYNLVLWIFIREHAYLYYVCYVLSAMFFQSVMSGYGYRYLWTDNDWLKDHSVVLSVGMCFVFAIAFVAHFLRLREVDRAAYRISMAGMFAYLILIWLSPFLSEATLTSIGQPLGLVLCFVAVWAAMRQWRTGSQVATFFVVGWTLLVVGTAIYTLMLAGFLPYNLVTRHIQEIGMLAEVVVLSFALAARINEEKQARRMALETSLGLAQRVNTAYQQQLENQSAMNRLLEERVAERTSELQSALNDLNEANARLEALSLTDALTGLHNRRYLDKQLPAWLEFACKQKTPLSALVIDVDHFKKINDTHGHLIGDYCLKAVGSSIRSTVHRPDDLVVRYGGEEFLIVLRNTDAAGALLVAERVRQNIESAHWMWEGRQVPVTVSIGLAELELNGAPDPSQLISRADAALYAAKTSGRNRVVQAA